MLAISLRPGSTRNPEHLLPGTPLGFEYMKQGKYISGDERGGFKVSGCKIKTFYSRERRLVRVRTS
jgi:hypothetical protein